MAADAVPLVDIGTDAVRDATEITIIAPGPSRACCPSSPGACAAAGANIVDAQALTTTDGLALDTITVARGFDRDEDEERRASASVDAVRGRLRGEIRLRI